MDLKLLAFDCDGVLLDSVGIKIDAFAAVASRFSPEAGEWLTTMHQKHPSVSRFIWFEELYRTWFSRSITEAEMAELNGVFRAASWDRLLKAPEIPGALDAVRKWKGRVPVFVCSGAPQEDLDRLFALRGIGGLFTRVCGSPPGKADLLARIVREAGVLPQETVMVGDSSSDWEAAERVGTFFYGCGAKMMARTPHSGPDLRGLDLWLRETAPLL